jgi:septum formation protein
MPLWLDAGKLVLASQSESRHAILAAAGIPHEIDPAHLDEREIERRAGGSDAGHVAAFLAREKALAVSGRHPGVLVLGADQTLAVGTHSLSKPRDRTAAREQLVRLRGRTHELHSAIAVARDDLIIFEHRDVARLTMREFSDAFLEKYVDEAAAAVTASIGAYQLERIGSQLFERVEGDHFVVLGLPLLPLLEFFRREGLLLA